MIIQIGWRGETVDVKGNLPPVGEQAPDFVLTANDLTEITLSDFAGQNLVLNIYLMKMNQNYLSYYCFK